MVEKVALNQGQQGVVPSIYVATTKKERSTGKDAMYTNVIAIKALAECIRATLGPKGLDVMIISPIKETMVTEEGVEIPYNSRVNQILGRKEVVVTNDGATILQKMLIEHPTAKMVVEASLTQEEEAGDGTTSVVLLASSLLENAEKLRNMGVHPTITANGYDLAYEKAVEIINSLSKNVNHRDVDTLKKIARTAMTGKGVESDVESLSKIAVDAVLSVEGNESVNVEENIKMVKRTGRGVRDTELIHGIVIDKARAHPRMPTVIKDARIALMDRGIEARKPEFQQSAAAVLKISDADQLKTLKNEDDIVVEGLVKNLADANVNVVMSEKAIDELGKRYLIKYGIFGVEKVNLKDLQKVSKATGARIVASTKELAPTDIGMAAVVEQVGPEGRESIYIRDAKDSKAVTVLIRAGTQQVADEIERSLDDAVRVVACVLEDGKMIAGGGATEIEIALKLREYANTLRGREQLAVNAYADAVESLVKTLIQNMGLNPLDIIADLKSAHMEGGVTKGVDVRGVLRDMLSEGVVEALRVKKQMLKSATDTAKMVLRIDDVLASRTKEEEKEEKPPLPAGLQRNRLMKHMRNLSPRPTGPPPGFVPTAR